AEPGQSYIWPDPKRDLVDQLRDLADRVLALGRAGPGDRRAPGVLGRGQVLGRRLSFVSLALARDSQTDVPRERARQRSARQGGQALWARAAAARSLPRDLLGGVRRGSQLDPAPRVLALHPRSAR